MRAAIKMGLACAVLTASASGCKKSDNTGGGTGTVTVTGTATGTGLGTTVGTAPGTAAPTPMTGDQLAAWYTACWGHLNAGAWDQFRGCYADDASSSGPPPTQGADAIVAATKDFKAGFPDLKGEPQLTLVNGTNIASITWMRGTNTGPMKGPAGEMPATGKKMGTMVAHLITASAAGKVVTESMHSDSAALMGQLGMIPAGMPFRGEVTEGWPSPVVVVAKGDATEAQNLTVYNAGTEAFNRHDLAAAAATFADDMVWSDASSPTDQTKTEMLKGLGDMWGAFSDMKLTPASTWAAGDYVVATGTMAGTNDGKSVAMGLDQTGKKVEVAFLEIDRLKGGKVDRAWMFFDSAVFAQQLGLMDPHAAHTGHPGPPPAAKKPTPPAAIDPAAKTE